MQQQYYSGSCQQPSNRNVDRCSSPSAIPPRSLLEGSIIESFDISTCSQINQSTTLPDRLPHINRLNAGVGERRIPAPPPPPSPLLWPIPPLTYPQSINSGGKRRIAVARHSRIQPLTRSHPQSILPALRRHIPTSVQCSEECIHSPIHPSRASYLPSLREANLEARASE
eukprot:GHVU01034086.1.p1 GENE.GHVU01034086.1~~GHVU01034086.1.p1  ORF type:complete len:170 (+),score=4.44 GHVU01034086.1:563-1072(+)